MTEPSIPLNGIVKIFRDTIQDCGINVDDVERALPYGTYHEDYAIEWALVVDGRDAASYQTHSDASKVAMEWRAQGARHVSIVPAIGVRTDWGRASYAWRRITCALYPVISW